jgi:hypothetical protein
MSPDHEEGPQLIFEPDWWEIKLNDGSLIELRADSVKENEDCLTFFVLARGEPNVEFEMFRIPLAAVAEWGGFWFESRHEAGIKGNDLRRKKHWTEEEL